MPERFTPEFQENIREYEEVFENWKHTDGKEIQIIENSVEGIIARTPDIRSISENPINPEKAKLIESPDYLQNLFEHEGFEPVRPLPIKSDKATTTLFVTAGVQNLEPLIHRDEQPESEKFFVAQPCIRSQFSDKVGEGVSTSFVNISTELVNPSPEEHFKAINSWITVLGEQGLSADKLSIFKKQSQPKWGGKSMENDVIKLYYKGLEIGDAVYIQKLHNGERELKISDIGFGLERLRWILAGGHYLGQEAPTSAHHQAIDSSKTLSLLLGSGIEPSNNEHGYRSRLFAKKLVSGAAEAKLDARKLFADNLAYWEKWAESMVSPEQANESFDKEYQRNFNRLLLDRLSQDYSDVGIDINQPTEKVIKALKGTSVDFIHLKQVLTELSYEE